MKTSRKLRFPAPREWQNIVQDFELMPTQAETLKVTLEEVLDAINQYQAKLQNQPSRSDLVKGLKDFEKALRRLRDECRRSANLMHEFLPHDTLGYVGESLTFSAMGEALGKNVIPRSFNDKIEVNGRWASVLRLSLWKNSRVPAEKPLV
jgi:hypothetical protein